MPPSETATGQCHGLRERFRGAFLGCMVGDAITIAAMSGALCGALVGEEGIPASWLERLRQEPRGPSHVRSLADSTFELWATRPPA